MNDQQENNYNVKTENKEASISLQSLSMGNETEEEGPSKRHAKKGQWQTPPVGQLFAASDGIASSSSTDPKVNLPPSDLEIPSTSDDYAKALQEAYRKGAEAASALSQQRSTTTPLSNEAAPFQGTNVLQQKTPKVSQVAQNANSTHLGVPTPIPFVSATPTTKLSTSLPNQPNQHLSSSATATTNQYQNNARTQPLMNTAPLSSAIIPERAPSSTAFGSAASRSTSMPDMSRLQNHKQDDEETKRLKRLARNRASARLRRQRKKNLVESYESEVHVLESSLAKLRAHKWGVGTDTNSLVEALSMDRGQQKIDAVKRKDLINSILAQQREQVEGLMDCQLENLALTWLSETEHEESESADERELAQELNQVLGLTNDQKSQLKSLNEGINEEMNAINVVDASLSALMSNTWLMNSGIETCTEQFTNILNPTQTSKFLLWVDHNAEIIDQLDYVNAPSADDHPDTTQKFTFGIDEAGDA